MQSGEEAASNWESLRNQESGWSDGRNLCIMEYWYESGKLEFDNYLDGVYHIDNVIIATPDMEETIFSERFDPETMEAAVEPASKLATTWSKIKSH